ncbi:ATP-binding protein [Caldicellulosiruptor morganii]|uniref:histidine kinase n=1 Tax=Caldicellulosiruptor morganii TaxID=1387555 RepID=A0ABY7BPD1_9FIRM|nr:ATP-binding protein [Caldicellulosiruptor morganii]WAM32881.1 ATP-binding protein [Caldicellulosiruptor morganii]
MNELSLYILDLVQNSIEAGATIVKIEIIEDLVNDKFSISVKDNGKGIPKDVITKVTDPFYTTRKTRKVGLGLALASQLAKDCNGKFSVDSSGKGTEVKIELQNSHIDRPPLGNIIDTLLTLIATAPQVDFVYIHKTDKGVFAFDTKKLKDILGEDVPLNLPSVLEFIKRELSDGLSNLFGGANIND